jgi:REP-associated tyrosine transposase
MANTYTQLYIHIVFVVKNRQNLIPKKHKDELYKYISGIIRERNSKLLAIGGVADHVHIFIGMNPSLALSDLVRDIKAVSSGFINKQHWIQDKFNWQEGYGAFSYSKSQIDRVCKYILNQEAHHRKKTFRDEYIKMLKSFSVDYDERYLFKWIE